jgi:hypothetical protein
MDHGPYACPHGRHRAGRVGGDRSAPPLVEPDVQISRIRLSRRCRLRHAQLLAWPFGRVSISCMRMSSRRVSAKPSSVVGIAANRFSCRLTPRLFCKAPSLHRHYPASSLLRASPPPSGPFAVIDSRFPLARATQEGFPGSSTDLSSRAAPNHPGDPDRCLLVSSRPMAGFILFGGLADPVFLTRPNRVRLRCGSRVHPREASTLRVSPHAARRLHVARAITW